MLTGTVEELRYHTTRAAQELEQSRQCQDELVKRAHIKLAKLHLNRSELIAALRRSEERRLTGQIYRTDKEG